MKKIILIAFVFLALKSEAQTSKDSCANTPSFQGMVRDASLIASYNLLADTSLHDATVTKYAQRLISDPQGGWITGMSYGVLTNPVINCGSPMGDIQFEVNSIFSFQAYAYYQTPPINVTQP